MAEAQPEQSQQKQPDINQTIDQVLRDGKVSKEELQIISGQYQSQKEDISDATKTKSHNLMKESLTSMLKDYTISDSDDLTKLKTMIADLGLNYTIDPSVKPTQRHIKVRLVDSVIRPVGAWHGWFTPENQGSLSITDIFSYRKDQHISNAISSGYYPTHRDTVGALREYFEDKLGDMNAAMYSNNSNSTYDSAEEAYQSIIYTITHGGDMHRPSTADREEIHFRSAKDVKKAQKYLMDLINTDIREKYNKETNEPSIAPVATPTPAPAPVASSPATSEPTPAPAPSVAPAQKSPEARKAFDNSQFFQEHKDQIDKINLDDKNPLKLLLDAYKKTQSYNNIVAIQTELKKGTNALVVDGDFGENTLKTLLEQTNPNTQTESGVDIDIHNQTSTSRILGPLSIDESNTVQSPNLLRTFIENPFVLKNDSFRFYEKNPNKAIPENRINTIPSKDQAHVNDSISTIKGRISENVTNVPNSIILMNNSKGMIEYGLIDQGDQEYYLWDQPEEKSILSQKRAIYRLNQDNQILGKVVMRTSGSLVEVIGDINPELIKYNPPVKTNNS